MDVERDLVHEQTHQIPDVSIYLLQGIAPGTIGKISRNVVKLAEEAKG